MSVDTANVELEHTQYGMVMPWSGSSFCVEQEMNDAVGGGATVPLVVMPEVRVLLNVVSAEDRVGRAAAKDEASDETRVESVVLDVPDGKVVSRVDRSFFADDVLMVMVSVIAASSTICSNEHAGAVVVISVAVTLHPDTTCELVTVQDVLVESINVQLTKESVTVEAEQRVLDVVVVSEDGGSLEASGLSAGPSVLGAGPDGLGHSPAICTPKILIQGR